MSDSYLAAAVAPRDGRGIGAGTENMREALKRVAPGPMLLVDIFD